MEEAFLVWDISILREERKSKKLTQTTHLKVCSDIVYVKFAHITLAKVSNMSKPKVSGPGSYPSPSENI